MSGGNKFTPGMVKKAGGSGYCDGAVIERLLSAVLCPCGIAADTGGV